MSESIGSCFTVTYEGFAVELASPVDVAPGSNGHDPIPELSVKAKAIWDTGAMVTAITPAVAKRLNLKTVSITEIATPSGTKECSQYLVDILLPNMVRANSITVVEAIPSSCDVLIGLDIIRAGDFAVSNYDGRTSFSFRVPSMQCFDFTKHSYQ
ncbi:MAG: retroviral-like aspartic protease family protein [Eggerthellaceae bacterium]|nr:retroviral-like aspartic protease family protein [Eggerthellaceae bacterium]